jgi:UDP-3-O-acyl N-acetylglucosamine deacetylase
MVRGVGLFSGAAAQCTFRPGEPGSGVAFRRADMAGSPTIPASVRNVVGEPAKLGIPLPSPARCTILASGGAFVLTVEHVMSALAGLGVTDALVELRGPEVPACDGSARPFALAIVAAGLPEAAGRRPAPLILDREIVVGDDRSGTVTATPRREPGFRMCYELDYGPGAPIPRQRAEWSPGDNYARDVAPARTFSLLAEAEAMKAAGLFRHLTVRDMLVIGPAGPVENEYRFPDEPARHKLLDLIGDLALIGRPIQADIVGRRSGHHLNHAMARAILEATGESTQVHTEGAGVRFAG